MPPPSPICCAVSLLPASVVDRPSATPAPTSTAVRIDARPIAESHPKKSLPHWMPPKRSRWRGGGVAGGAGGGAGGGGGRGVGRGGREHGLVALGAVVDAVAVEVVVASGGAVAADGAARRHRAVV